jgi:hypothetical protein
MAPIRFSLSATTVTPLSLSRRSEAIVRRSQSRRLWGHRAIKNLEIRAPFPFQDAKCRKCRSGEALLRKQLSLSADNPDHKRRKMQNPFDRYLWKDKTSFKKERKPDFLTRQATTVARFPPALSPATPIFREFPPRLLTFSVTHSVPTNASVRPAGNGYSGARRKPIENQMEGESIHAITPKVDYPHETEFWIVVRLPCCYS